VIPFFGFETANYRQFVCLLRQFRHVFTEPNAGNLGGDLFELAAVFMAWLHVPRIGLARTASHPQQNTVPAPTRVRCN